MNPLENEMREACHLLAEHIMRTSAPRNSMIWLKRQMLDILLNPDNITSLAEEYSEDYPYANVQNTHLVEILKDYDNY